MQEFINNPFSEESELSVEEKLLIRDLESRGIIIIPNSTPLHANYLLKARICALEGNHGQINTADGEALTLDDFYVVWFAKTLQNWKALVSTDAVRSHYWEVTYNGDKRETYVDTYLKEGNEVIDDNFFDTTYSPR